MKLLKNLTSAACLLSLATVPVLAQDGGEPHTIRQVDPVVLAEFELPNGNEVRFYGVPEDGELIVGEISDAGYERFSIRPGTPAAKVFFELAPADTPVPRMIAETDEDLFRWHEKVDVLEKKVQVAGAAAGPLTKALTKAGSGSCQSGSAGADYFRTHHCYTSGGPGYGKKEEYCYDGSWNSLQKTSDSAMRATYTRMASCGDGTNWLRHFYNSLSGYQTQLTIYVAPQKVVNYWSARTGLKWKRRVRMEELNSAGWIRGWIKYHDQVAETWP